MTGLALLAPSPAQAAVSVTISATRTTLVVGETTTIKGKAVDARPGSVVKLQRKVSGVWRAVKEKKVWSTRTYSFTIKPPKGYQYYRVLKPRQLGQAAATSGRIQLLVRWRPGISVTGTNVFEPETGAHWFDVEGETTGVPPYTFLRRQTRTQSGSWLTDPIAAGAETEADGTFARRVSLADASVVRFFVPASGARLAAYSAPMSVSWEPYTVQLNSSVRVEGLGASSPQAVTFSAVAGQDISIAFTEQNWWGNVSTQLLGPGGLITLLDGRFQAPSTGTYKLTLADIYDDSHALTVSVATVKVVEGALDTSSEVDGDLPGQVVDLTFVGAAGDVVTQYSPPVQFDCTEIELRHNGSVVAQTANRLNNGPSSTNYFAPIWMLPEDGIYSLRHVPCYARTVDTSEALMRGLDASPVIDESPGTAQLSDPGRVAYVEVETHAGQEVTVEADPTSSGFADVNMFFYKPDGSNFRPSYSGFRTDGTTPGTYRIFASIQPGKAGALKLWASTPINLQPVLDGEALDYDLGPFLGRELIVGVTGSVGQRFAIVADSNGLPCSIDGVLTFEGSVSGPDVRSALGRDVYRLWGDGAHALRMRGCRGSTSLRAVSVAEPVSLTIDGAPQDIAAGLLGRPGLASVAVTPGDRVKILIDTSTLANGSSYWGSVDLGFNTISFTGTASASPQTILLNQTFSNEEYVLSLTTQNGVAGTFAATVERY